MHNIESAVHQFEVTITGRIASRSSIVFVFDRNDVLFRPAAAELCANLLLASRNSPDRRARHLLAVAGTRDNLNTLILRNRQAIDSTFGRGTGIKTIQCVYPGIFTINAELIGIENGFLDLCDHFGWKTLAQSLTAINSSTRKPDSCSADLDSVCTPASSVDRCAPRNPEYQ